MTHMGPVISWKFKSAHSPRRENDHVRRERRSIFEFQPALAEALDRAVVLQLDLAIRDELARANV